MGGQDVECLNFLELLHSLQGFKLFLHALYGNLFASLEGDGCEDNRECSAALLVFQLVLIHAIELIKFAINITLLLPISRGVLPQANHLSRLGRPAASRKALPGMMFGTTRIIGGLLFNL